MSNGAAGRQVPPLLFFGFAVASIGGPLALAAIYATGALGRAVPSAGLVTLVGAVLAGFPLLVWLRYSEEIVSHGGLTAFVEAAAGRRLALLQAAVWAFSYFLYLPYTVGDVVYEMLPVVFPGVHPWRPVLEVALPVALVAFVLTGVRPVLGVLLVSAAVQVVLMLALGYVELSHHGAASSSFTHAPAAHPFARGSANIALLFVCGSLPLFLGPEVRGLGRTVRTSLTWAWALAGAYLVFAVFPLARVPAALRDTALPGYTIAAAYSGRPLAVAVGLGAALSVVGVIVAEYLALSRLLHYVFGVSIRRLLLLIGVAFVALDVVSLANPDEFDERTLRPSLTALFVSQLIVIAVFPLYRKRRGKLTVLDVAVAAVAFALMAWGLYRSLWHPVSTEPRERLVHVAEHARGLCLAPRDDLPDHAVAHGIGLHIRDGQLAQGRCPLPDRGEPLRLARPDGVDPEVVRVEQDRAGAQELDLLLEVLQHPHALVHGRLLGEVDVRNSVVTRWVDAPPHLWP